MKLTYNFEISDAAFALLRQIFEIGSVEYRDPEFENLEQYRRNIRPDDSLTESAFLIRNFEGTFDIAMELLDRGLIEPDGMAWYSTFQVSTFGKTILEQNNL